jgi:hypothetical protein
VILLVLFLRFYLMSLGPAATTIFQDRQRRDAVGQSVVYTKPAMWMCDVMPLLKDPIGHDVR